MTQTGPWSVKGIDQRARHAAREAAGAEGMTLGEYLNKLLLAADKEEPNEVARPYTAPQPKPDAASSTLDRLTRRIEATEARSTLAITGMDQTVLGLVARLENAEQTSASIAGHVDGLIDELRQTHEALQNKVEHLEGDNSAKQNLEALKSLEQALGKLASHVYEENELAHTESEAIKGRVESGFSDITERVESMETKVETTLSDAAARVERAVEQAELRAEGTARHLSERLSDLETNVSERLAGIGNADQRLDAVESDVSGALESMEGTLLRIQDRLNRAETTTDAALKSLESTFEHLDERIEAVASTVDPELAERLRAEFEARFEDISASVQDTIANTRQELAEEITRAATGVETGVISDLKGGLDDVRKKLSETDERQNRAIETVGSQVSRLSSSVDERISELESQDETATAEAVRDQIDRLSENVSEKIETIADHVDARVTESEQRSADAIEQIGDQVASVTGRIQSRQDEAIRLLQKEMADTHKRSDARLSDALANVSERLEEMQARSAEGLSPVQKAIASLATRLEAVEEFNAPPFSKHLEADEMSAFDVDAGQNDAPFEAGIDFAEPAEAVSAATDHDDIFPSVESSDSVDTTDDAFEPLETFRGDADTAGSDGVSFEDEWQVRPESEDRYKEDFDAISAAAAAISAEDIPEHNYIADLPEPDEINEEFPDPLAELGEFDHGQSETRESDIFDDEDAGDFAAATDEAESFAAEDANETGLALDEEAEASTGDYIARARKAAIAASESGSASGLTSSNRSGKRGGGGGSKSGGGGSKTPLYAAASAVVITGAAVGGYLHLRGKQSAPVQTVSVNTYQDPGANAAEITTPPPEVDEAAVAVFEGSLEASAAIDGSEMLAATEEDLFDIADTEVPEEEALAGEPGDEGEAFASESGALAAATYPEIPAALTVERAAASGNRIAQYQLGQSWIDSGDLQEGANLIRKSAEKGLPVAQYRLAKLHEKGLGVPKDLSRAREWTEKAAQGGNVKAMHDLAVFMAEGDGGAQSYAGAVEWFRKGAEYGVVDSQYNLGVLYEQGLGISPNLTEALFWFNVAANNNDAGAPAKVQELSERVSAEAASQARRQAASWRAARANAISNGRFGAQPWNTGNPLQVKAVQTALAALGYKIGEPDGITGPATDIAIRNYQKANGLTVNGEVREELIEHMNQAREPDARG